jgi:protoheme IX farnesyltransferase
MLPVVRGDRETTKQIVLYSVVLLGVVVVPFVLGEFGLTYLVSALALTGVFLALAIGLRVQTTHRRASLLFHYSLLYLALLFAAVAIDPVLA